QRSPPAGQQPDRGTGRAEDRGRRQRLELAARRAGAGGDRSRRLFPHQKTARPFAARTPSPPGARECDATGRGSVKGSLHALRALALAPFVLVALGLLRSFYFPYLRLERPALALPV